MKPENWILYVFAVKGPVSWKKSNILAALVQFLSSEIP